MMYDIITANDFVLLVIDRLQTDNKGGYYVIS